MFRCSGALFKRPFPVLRRASNCPHFDVCVIGAGPAGISAALSAVNYNKKVCIVESSRVGGTDLWNGALQSKTLWEISKFVSRVTKSTISSRVFDPEIARKLQSHIDESRIRNTLQEVSKTKEQQILKCLESSGISLIYGKGIFSSPNEIDVHSVGTGEYRVISADYFLIATGSTQREHPLFKRDRRMVLTTEQLFQIPIPKSLVIVGAGVIGCETAATLANLGMTRVSLIDRARRILPMEDEDISATVQRQLLKRGVTIHQDCTLFDLGAVKGGSGSDMGCQYSVQHPDGSVETFVTERALISIGRVPNYRGLGLENLSCKIRDMKLELDQFNRCVPYKHIYVIGDATADRSVLNLAEAQGRRVVDHIYSGKRQPFISSSDIENVSTVMFLDEEVACVGLNEQDCRSQGISYLVARFDYKYDSRSLAAGETGGFCKLIVTNDHEKRILGARALGTHAGSVVEITSLAVRNRQSAYDLLKLVPSYPSLAKGFVECIRMSVGSSVLKPNSVPEVTLREWRPRNFERGRAYEDVTVKTGPEATKG